MFYFYKKKKRDGRKYYNWRVGVRVSHPFGNPSPDHGVHSNQKAPCLSLPQHLPSVLNHVLTSDSRFHIRNLWRLNTGLFNLSTKLKKNIFPPQLGRFFKRSRFKISNCCQTKLSPNTTQPTHTKPKTRHRKPNKTQQLWQHNAHITRSAAQQPS